MAYVQRITVRFDEVDFARVVYFPNLFGYCHRVFEQFFADEVKVPYAQMLQARKVGFPTVHTQADFRAPFRFGDVCRVVMETTQVSRRSIRSRYRLHPGDSPQLAAEVTLVTAPVDMDRFRAVDVPEDVRAAFERHAAV